MVTTETLQVILNAKDQLSGKIREVNNALKQTGTSATLAGTTATNATNRIGQAYQQLQSKVSQVFNTIRNTIRNSTTGQAISSSGIAQPFLNAAETIKQRFSSMTEVVKGKLKGMIGNQVITIRGDNGDIIKKITVTRSELEKIKQMNVDPFKNISTAGLQVLNGELGEASIKAAKFQGTSIQVGNSVKTITTSFGGLSGIASGVFAKLGTGWDTVKNKMSSFKNSLSGMGSKMTSIVSGLSGVQSAIMGAFGAVGVTSISKFTIGAAIARQKLNAVTTSITGSEAATKSLNSAISKATSGGIIGFTKVAQAVQQIGIKYNLSNKQLEATAPVLNKIGTLARAMGKDGETAASMMAKAYDGLNGNFLQLKRNLGITKQQLLDAGWSGAADDVDGYTLALNKVLDTKPEMQAYLNSFEGQYERLQLAIQGVGRSIGEIVLPVLNAVLGFFLEMHQHAPWLTTAIVGIGIAILGVISVLTALAPILFLIEEELITISLSTMWPLLLVAAVIAVIAVLKHLYDTNEKVRQTMDHIGQVINATLVKAWDKLQKITQPLIQTFNHLMQVFGRLGSDLLSLFGITGDAADNFDWLGAIIEAVGFVIEQQINNIVLFVEVLASVLVPVISYVINVIANLINFFISLGEALTLLSQGDIMGFLTTLGMALWTFISDTITNLGQMFLEIFNNLNVIFGGVLLSVWNWLVQLITTMIWGGWQMVVGFLSWIMSLPGQFWNYLVMCWNSLTTWAGQIISKAIDTGSRMVSGFIQWISTLPGKFWNWLLNALNKIGSFASQGVQKMKDTAKRMLDGFVSWIKNLPSKMGEYLNGIKQQIWNKAGGLVSAIMQLGWNMLNSFKDALLGGLWGSAELNTAETGLITGFTHLEGSVNNAGLMLGTSFNKGFLDGIDKGGLNNIGISGNSNILSKVEHEITNNRSDKTNELLTEIKTALANLRVTHTGQIDFNQNVDVTGDTNLTDEELREAITLAIQDRNILKQIVNSREFQAMDKKMKNRMVREIGRHI